MGDWSEDKEAEHRESDLGREGGRLGDASPDNLAKSLDDLNSCIIASAKEGLKLRGSKEELKSTAQKYL